MLIPPLTGVGTAIITGSLALGGSAVAAAGVYYAGKAAGKAMYSAYQKFKSSPDKKYKEAVKQQEAQKSFENLSESDRGSVTAVKDPKTKKFWSFMQKSSKASLSTTDSTPRSSQEKQTSHNHGGRGVG